MSETKKGDMPTSKSRKNARKSKGSKDGTSSSCATIKPSSSKDQKRAEVEQRIRKQVACEERAFRIVERLLDNPVTPEYLKDAGQHITPDHYQDVTEERAIARQCGYPLCANPHTVVLKQKYHISLKTNRVFDITDRKNFCSSKCYKASEYFKKQIPTSPVWTRDQEPPAQFDLLNVEKESGVIGVVLAHQDDVKTEIEELERLDQLRSGKKYKECKDNGPEVTTVKELAKQVSEMLLLDDTGQDIEGTTKSDSTDQEIEGSTSTYHQDPLECSENILASAENRTEHIPTSSVLHTDEKEAEELEKGEVDKQKQTEMKIQAEYLQAAIEDVGKMKNQTNEVNFSFDKCDVTATAKRTAENLTSEKTQMLMDMIDKRERMKTRMEFFKNQSHTEVNQESQINPETPASSHQVLPELIAEKINRVEIDERLDLQKQEHEKYDSQQLIADKVESLENKKGQSLENQKSLEKELGQVANTAAMKAEVKETAFNHNVEKEALGKTDQTVNDDTEMISKKVKVSSSAVLENIKRLKQQQSKSKSEDGETNLGESQINVVETKTKSKHCETLNKPQINPVETKIRPIMLIRRILSEWKTLRTVAFLRGGEGEDRYSGMSKEEFDLAYQALGKKVDMYEKEDILDPFGEEQKEKGTRNMKKLPDYQALKLETEQLDLKVKEYFKGKMMYPVVEPVEEESDKTRSEHGVVEHDDSAPVLPLVDNLAQVALRQRIVLDRLNKVLPSLLSPMRISIMEISTDVRSLINTFNLTSFNIVLKPGEWSMMAIVLLKILSMKNKVIASSLQTESTQGFYNMFMTSLNISSHDLDAILLYMMS